MKRHFEWIMPVMAVLLLGLPFAGHAQSQQVYTWVDKNGVRHYSDQPRSKKAVLVTVQAAPAMSSPPAASLPAAATKGTPQPAPQPRSSATPAQRAAHCAKLRRQVKQLQSARRVVVTRNGKKQFYTGDNLVKFRRQMQQRMKTVCTPP